jgi:hypothetical protein
VSKANPEANHRCEGWMLYGGVESWQGFPREHTAPGTGKRAKRILWRAGEPTAERAEIFGGGVGV